MNKIVIVSAISILASALGACNKQEAATQNTIAGPMANMAMPEANKAGKGTGTVTAVDAVAGKITIDHGPVAELQWPAMKMAFGAKPDTLKGIAVGDKVAFEFTMTGTNAEVTNIAKQP